MRPAANRNVMPTGKIAGMGSSHELRFSKPPNMIVLRAVISSTIVNPINQPLFSMKLKSGLKNQMPTREIKKVMSSENRKAQMGFLFFLPNMVKTADNTPAQPANKIAIRKAESIIGQPPCSSGFVFSSVNF